MKIALLTVYCLLTLAAALVGGSLPLLIRLTHARMQLAISFVAGVMLGVGLLGMLPHSVKFLQGDANAAAWTLLMGFLVMFLVQRFLHVHHHVAPGDDESHAQHHRGAKGDLVHLHVHGVGGDHACEQHDTLPATGVIAAEKFSWSGAALGLALHTLLGGLALAAAVESQMKDGVGWTAGLGAFLAIILHKPFDALTITTLMKAGGWSNRDCHFVVSLFALSMPVGILLFYLGFHGGGAEGLMVGRVLGLSAGAFVCVAASDLLPEMQFHSHDRVKLTAALLAGIGLAWLVEKVAHG